LKFVQSRDIQTYFEAFKESFNLILSDNHTLNASYSISQNIGAIIKISIVEKASEKILEQDNTLQVLQFVKNKQLSETDKLLKEEKITLYEPTHFYLIKATSLKTGQSARHSKMPKKKLICYFQTFLIHMNSKNQFVLNVLGMLGYKSKQDVIENLFIKSIQDTYIRIDKNIGIENDIRDRFIYDFYYNSTLLKGLINRNILFVNWERWVFKNADDLGRTDLSFAISGIEFIIECKRLKSVSAQYIEEGLYRFINKDYSENETYAGMMGFVVDGDIKSICSSLEIKCKAENYCENDFVKAKTNIQENSFITSHYRKEIDSINIYHLFYAFNLE
jgi:hypothetical protein